MIPTKRVAALLLIGVSFASCTAPAPQPSAPPRPMVQTVRPPAGAVSASLPRTALPNASGPACFASSIMSPQPFLGVHDEVFRLLDGSLWQVQFEYEYLYAFYPDVIVCSATERLIIEGKSLKIRALSIGRRGAPYTPLNGGLSVIESRIEGDFEGWDGDTIFRLQNGQIWKQASYSYRYHYAFAPRVTIIPVGGGHEMMVDGVSQRVRVVRLR
jgi:hypothetical protein